jgi:hypothetical protein
MPTSDLPDYLSTANQSPAETLEPGNVRLFNFLKRHYRSGKRVTQNIYPSRSHHSRARHAIDLFVENQEEDGLLLTCEAIGDSCVPYEHGHLYPDRFILDGPHTEPQLERKEYFFPDIDRLEIAVCNDADCQDCDSLRMIIGSKVYAFSLNHNRQHYSWISVPLFISYLLEHLGFTETGIHKEETPVRCIIRTFIHWERSQKRLPRKRA